MLADLIQENEMLKKRNKYLEEQLQIRVHTIDTLYTERNNLINDTNTIKDENRKLKKRLENEKETSLAFCLLMHRQAVIINELLAHLHGRASKEDMENIVKRVETIYKEDCGLWL